MLVGNKWTADALREIGHSTRGATGSGQRQLLLRCKFRKAGPTSVRALLQHSKQMLGIACSRILQETSDQVRS